MSSRWQRERGVAGEEEQQQLHQTATANEWNPCRENSQPCHENWLLNIKINNNLLTFYFKERIPGLVTNSSAAWNWNIL